MSATDLVHNSDTVKPKASKYVGVFRAGKKWKAQIQRNGQQIYLGIFQNEIDASYAYEASKQKHGQLVVGSKGKGKKAGKKSAAPPSSVVQPPKEQETSFEYIEEYANGLPALSSYCSRKDSSGPNPEKFDVVISATRVEELRLLIRLGENLMKLDDCEGLSNTPTSKATIDTLANEQKNMVDAVMIRFY